MIYWESLFRGRYWCKPSYLAILGPTVHRWLRQELKQATFNDAHNTNGVFPIPSILRRTQKKTKNRKMSRVSVVLLPQSWQVSDKPDLPEQSIIKHHRPTPNTTHLKTHSKTENDTHTHHMTKPSQITYQAGNTRKSKWPLLLSPRESNNANIWTRKWTATRATQS